MRIISIATSITWATTQPTPLEIVVTIDGQTLTFTKTNPVSATLYEVEIYSYLAEAAGIMSGGGTSSHMRAFLLEGRSVKVEVRVTWATTQPTPLVVRVKYAKIP